MPPKRTESSRSRRGGSIATAFGRGGKSSSNTAASERQLAAVAGAKRAIASGEAQKATTLRPPSPSAAAYTKEQLAEAAGRPDLDPNNDEYDDLWREVQATMGMPKHQPIHSEGMNRIEHILRVFDLDPSYGPCLGMTRLERWHRAEKLGDEPPVEIKRILETRQGVLDLKYSVLHDKGV